MKPLLKINSAVGQRLAQIALVGPFQDMFNLHPAGMADALQGKVKKNAIDVCSKYHLRTRDLANSCMEVVIAQLRLGGISVAMNYNDEDKHIAEFFNLDSIELAKRIKKGANAEFLNPVEVAEFIKAGLPDVLLWAFAETERILIAREEKK